MRTAMIFSYVLIGVLAVVVIWQQITIGKLIPKTNSTPSGNPNETEPASPETGRFGDIIQSVQNQLQPKELTVKF